MKQTFSITGEDNKKMSFDFKLPDGSFMNVGWIDYTRVKKEPKKKKEKKKK